MTIRQQPAAVAGRLWDVLRTSAAVGLSATDAAARSNASVAYVRKTLRSWAAGGYATYTSPATSERGDSGTYTIAANAPKAAPIVTSTGDVLPREGFMDSIDFARVCDESGLSNIALSTLLHLERTGQAIASLKAGARPVDARTATKVRLLDELLRA